MSDFLATLRNFPFFQRLLESYPSEGFLSKLKSAIKFKTYQRGETITHPGQKHCTFFGIIQGKVLQSFSTSDESKDHQVKQAGEALGLSENGMDITGKHPDYEASALEETRILLIERHTFKKIISSFLLNFFIFLFPYFPFKDPFKEAKNQEEVKLLMEIELFTGWSYPHILIFHSKLRQIHCTKGQVVIKESKPSDRLFLVSNGEFKVTQNSLSSILSSK